MGYIKHPVKDDPPPIGTKVIYSAFPDVAAADGEVVDTGILCTDPDVLIELAATNVSPLCVWENVESYLIVEEEEKLS